MIFSCDAQELNSALSVVSHSIAVRSPKPILEGVLLENCDEGLRLTCTDLSLGIETFIPAAFREEGRVVMPGKLFCEVIRKLPGGECTLSVNSRLQATVTCGAFRMSISGLDALEYPDLPEVKGDSFSMSEGRLRGMISGTLFATAVDESRPILTGCLMEMTTESVTMVALDGFRLALRRESLHGPEHNLQCVLPGKVMGELSRILSDSEEEIEIVAGGSHVLFAMGKTRIIARTLEGEYIRYRQILPAEWKTEMRIGRRELERAIDRASLIAREGRNNLVSFAIEGEQLRITSNSETSDTEEKIPVTTTGADLTIAFNVRYVTDVLKVIDDETVVMHFNSNVSPCVICPEQGEDYLYLVLPVRVFGAQ